MADAINHDLLVNIPMIERVAMFFVLIGEESTIKIFQNLPFELVEQISTAITQLSTIEKDVSLAILDEFHLFAKSSSYLSSGGFDYAKDLLYKSLGKAEADKILNKLTKMQQAKESFSYLENIESKQLANFIKDESEQTMAIILSHMNSVKAAEVLNTLDDALRVKITMQMATIKDVSPEIVRSMSVVLEKKLEALMSSISEVGGVKVVADMLNKLGPTANDILDNINGLDIKLAKNIKDNMFVFEDLIALESSDIMKVLAEIDVGEVAVALKGAPEEYIDSIMSAMSTRAKDRYAEEADMLGKVKLKDVEAAQRKMLEITSKFIESGEIERDLDE
jgi:flagellar motor switch protein FliG